MINNKHLLLEHQKNNLYKLSIIDELFNIMINIDSDVEKYSLLKKSLRMLLKLNNSSIIKRDQDLYVVKPMTKIERRKNNRNSFVLENFFSEELKKTTLDKIIDEIINISMKKVFTKNIGVKSNLYFHKYLLKLSKMEIEETIKTMYSTKSKYNNAAEIIIMRYTNKTIMSFVEQLFIHIGNKNDDDFEDNPGETFLKWYDGNIGIKIEKEKKQFLKPIIITNGKSTSPYSIIQVIKQVDKQKNKIHSLKLRHKSLLSKKESIINQIKKNSNQIEKNNAEILSLEEKIKAKKKIFNTAKEKNQKNEDYSYTNKNEEVIVIKDKEKFSIMIQKEITSLISKVNELKKDNKSLQIKTDSIFIKKEKDFQKKIKEINETLSNSIKILDYKKSLYNEYLDGVSKTIIKKIELKPLKE